MGILRLLPPITVVEMPLRLIPVKEGSVTADGTEQTLFETTSAGVYEGWIDVSNLQSGDQVVLRLYVKPYSGSDWKKVDEVSVSGPHDKPAVPLARIAVIYGFKVTLQQTAGTYRTFSFQILREE